MAFLSDGVEHFLISIAYICLMLARIVIKPFRRNGGTPFNISKLFFLLVAFSIYSCRSPQSVIYFNDLNGADLKSPAVEQLNSVVQSGDQLYIFINAANAEAVEAYNLTNFSSSKFSTSVKGNQIDPVIGYSIDQEGYIEILNVGKINVIGKTLASIKQELQERLKEFLINPIVTIRLLNFHVTVLGEVNLPGTYNIPYSRVDLLQALGYAGDLTINGKRENILVIRQTESGKITKRVNITQSEVISNPFYYLQSGDVVYVEPNRTRINNGSVFLQIWPTVASAATLAILILVNLK